MIPYQPKPASVAAFELGQTLDQQGKTHEAVESLTEAIAADGQFWEAYQLRARLYGKLGDKFHYRVDKSHADWLKHRWILEPYRVRPGDRRTTPEPVLDNTQDFPELKSLATTTVRLHPRFGDEPAINASKLGGTFLWPAEESWPVCSTHQIPLVSVLQLRANDFPEMPFPLGKDLFQMLWCPREHSESSESGRHWADPAFFWRKREDITRPRIENPAPLDPFYEYVPFPCRLMPERVVEYPSEYDLDNQLVERIYAWQDANLRVNEKGWREHKYCYEFEFSVCAATKIGGYLNWIQFPWKPTCSCGRLMEHLLTIESIEGNANRWIPIEEQRLFKTLDISDTDWDTPDNQVRRALCNPTGLMLGDCGNMQLFVCRHCPGWPIVPSIACC